MKNGQVTLYSIVTIKSDSTEKVFTLVPTGKINIPEGKISIESPLGKALLNHREDEEIKVVTPTGLQYFKIISIN